MPGSTIGFVVPPSHGVGSPIGHVDDPDVTSLSWDMTSELRMLVAAHLHGHIVEVQEDAWARPVGHAARYTGAWVPAHHVGLEPQVVGAMFPVGQPLTGAALTRDVSSRSIAVHRVHYTADIDVFLRPLVSAVECGLRELGVASDPSAMDTTDPVYEGGPGSAPREQTPESVSRGGGTGQAVQLPTLHWTTTRRRGKYGSLLLCFADVGVRDRMLSFLWGNAEVRAWLGRCGSDISVLRKAQLPVETVDPAPSSDVYGYLLTQPLIRHAGVVAASDGAGCLESANGKQGALVGGTIRTHGTRCLQAAVYSMLQDVTDGAEPDLEAGSGGDGEDGDGGGPGPKGRRPGDRSESDPDSGSESGSESWDRDQGGKPPEQTGDASGGDQGRRDGGQTDAIGPSGDPGPPPVAHQGRQAVGGQSTLFASPYLAQVARDHQVPVIPFARQQEASIVRGPGLATLVGHTPPGRPDHSKAQVTAAPPQPEHRDRPSVSPQALQPATSGRTHVVAQLEMIVPGPVPTPRRHRVPAAAHGPTRSTQRHEHPSVSSQVNPATCGRMHQKRVRSGGVRRDGSPQLPLGGGQGQGGGVQPLQPPPNGDGGFGGIGPAVPTAIEYAGAHTLRGQALHILLEGFRAGGRPGVGVTAPCGVHNGDGARPQGLAGDVRARGGGDPDGMHAALGGLPPGATVDGVAVGAAGGVDTAHPTRADAGGHGHTDADKLAGGVDSGGGPPGAGVATPGAQPEVSAGGRTYVHSVVVGDVGATTVIHAEAGWASPGGVGAVPGGGEGAAIGAQPEVGGRNHDHDVCLGDRGAAGAPGAVLTATDAGRSAAGGTTVDLGGGEPEGAGPAVGLGDVNDTHHHDGGALVSDDTVAQGGDTSSSGDQGVRALVDADVGGSLGDDMGVGTGGQAGVTTGQSSGGVLQPEADGGPSSSGAASADTVVGPLSHQPQVPGVHAVATPGAGDEGLVVHDDSGRAMGGDTGLVDGDGRGGVPQPVADGGPSSSGTASAGTVVGPLSHHPQVPGVHAVGTPGAGDEGLVAHDHLGRTMGGDTGLVHGALIISAGSEVDVDQHGEVGTTWQRASRQRCAEHAVTDRLELLQQVAAPYLPAHADPGPVSKRIATAAVSMQGDGPVSVRPLSPSQSQMETLDGGQCAAALLARLGQGRHAEVQVAEMLVQGPRGKRRRNTEQLAALGQWIANSLDQGHLDVHGSRHPADVQPGWSVVGGAAPVGLEAPHQSGRDLDAQSLSSLDMFGADSPCGGSSSDVEWGPEQGTLVAGHSAALAKGVRGKGGPDSRSGARPAPGQDVLTAHERLLGRGAHGDGSCSSSASDTEGSGPEPHSDADSEGQWSDVDASAGEAEGNMASGEGCRATGAPGGGGPSGGHSGHMGGNDQPGEGPHGAQRAAPEISIVLEGEVVAPGGAPVAVAETGLAWQAVTIGCFNLGNCGWQRRGAVAVTEYLTNSAAPCSVLVLGETHLRIGDDGQLPAQAMVVDPGGKAALVVHHSVASRVHRTGGHRWGGVAVCALVGGRAPLEAATWEEECPRADVVWVRLQLRHRQRPIMLCAAYLPPSMANVTSVCAGDCLDTHCPRVHIGEALDYIEASLPRMAALGDIVLCGDLNADPRPYSNPVYRGRWGVLCTKCHVLNPHPREVPAGQPVVLAREWDVAVAQRRDHGLFSLAVGTGCTPTTVHAHGLRQGSSCIDHILIGVTGGHSPDDTVVAQQHIVPVRYDVHRFRSMTLSDHALVCVTLSVSSKQHLSPVEQAAVDRLREAVAALHSPGPQHHGALGPRFPDGHLHRGHTKAGDWGWLSEVGHSARYNTILRAFVLRCFSRSLAKWMRENPPTVWGEDDGMALALGGVQAQAATAAGAAGASRSAGDGDAWRADLFTFAGEVAHALKLAHGPQSRGVNPGVAPLVAELRRTMDLLHRKWKQHWRQGDRQGAEDTLVALKEARRAAGRASATYARAVTARRVAALLHARSLNDVRGMYAVVKSIGYAAYPLSKQPVPEALARRLDLPRSGANESGALVEAARVVGTPAIVHAAGVAAQDVNQLAAEVHARFIKGVLTDQGVEDKRFPAGPLTAAQAQVEAALRECAADPEGNPPLSRPITEQEVLDALKHLDAGSTALGISVASLKAAGLGDAPEQREVRLGLLKHLNDEWVPAVPRLQSMQSIVTPIHKKGATDDPGNYRSIACGDAMGRVLHTIIAKRLTAHFSGTEYIHPGQAGFLPGRSTVENILLSRSLLALHARGPVGDQVGDGPHSGTGDGTYSTLWDTEARSDDPDPQAGSGGSSEGEGPSVQDHGRPGAGTSTAPTTDSDAGGRHRGGARPWRPMVIYLDLRRAYASTNHTLLLARLHSIGVRGRMLTYLARWLQGQQASVKVGDAYSAWFPVTIGLPEGGPECPILFVLFYNPVLQELDRITDPDVGLRVPVFSHQGNVSWDARLVSLTFADDSRFFAASTRGGNLILTTLGRVLLTIRVLMNVGVAKTAWLLQDGDPLEGGAEGAVEGAEGAPRGTAPLQVPAQVVADATQEVLGAQGNVEVPPAAEYKYLGCMERLDATGCITYGAQVAAAVSKSAAHRRQLGHCGTYQLPPAAVGLSYMSLLQPSITYAMAVWNSDRAPIPQLEADMVGVMQSAARVATTFPHAVGYCVTGLRSFAHSRDTLLLQCIVSVCSRRRGDGHLRSVVTAELLAWERMTLRAHRSRLWVDGALALLLEVDDALRWNANPVPCVIGQGAEKGRPEGVQRQWYGEGLEAGDPQPIQQYHPTVLRILKHWMAPAGPGDQGAAAGTLSQKEEWDLVRRMDIYRYDAMQVLRYKRRVCEVWRLRGQVGIAHMNIASRPPPFAWCPRSEANRLRVQARGGVYALVGGSVYTALDTGRVQVRGDDVGKGAMDQQDVGREDSEGTSTGIEAAPGGPGNALVSVAACPLCTGPMTVPHLLRDCTALEGDRAEVWGEARGFLLSKGSDGPLVRGPPTSPLVSNVWYLLTMGEECPRASVMGDALEQEELAELRNTVRLLPTCPVARRALERAMVNSKGAHDDSGSSSSSGSGDACGTTSGQACGQCVNPEACVWCACNGPGATAPDLTVYDDGSDSDAGDEADEGDVEDGDVQSHAGEDDDVSLEPTSAMGVRRLGKDLTLGDLRPQLTVRQVQGRLRAQRRRRESVRTSLRLPTGQVVSGLASKLHLWQGLLAITGKLLQRVVDRVREAAERRPRADGDAEGTGGGGDVAPARGRGRPRLPVVPGGNLRARSAEVQRRRECGEKDPRGRPSQSLQELQAAWLAKKPAGSKVTDAEYVARKVRDRERAAQVRSAAPGTEKRPRGRPRKAPVGNDAGRARPAQGRSAPPMTGAEKGPRGSQRRVAGAGDDDTHRGSGLEGGPPTTQDVSTGAGARTRTAQQRSAAPQAGAEQRPRGRQRKGTGVDDGDTHRGSGRESGSPPAPPLPRVRGCGGGGVGVEGGAAAREDDGCSSSPAMAPPGNPRACSAEAQRRREGGVKDPRGRPSLSLQELQAAWLAKKPAGCKVPDAEYVARKVRDRDRAAQARSADPGSTLRRSRGRPRKDALGDGSPPVPPLPFLGAQGRDDTEVAGGTGACGDDGCSSPPVPPAPVQPRSSVGRGSESPPAPPVPRPQGVPPLDTPDAGSEEEGAGVPPVPPLRSTSLHPRAGGRATGAGQGALHASPIAPPGEHGGGGGGGGTDSGSGAGNVRSAPSPDLGVRTTRARAARAGEGVVHHPLGQPLSDPPDRHRGGSGHH